MIITDKGVEDLIKAFSFEFEDDLIEHNLVELISLYSLLDETGVDGGVSFLVFESLFF